MFFRSMAVFYTNNYILIVFFYFYFFIFSLFVRVFYGFYVWVRGMEFFYSCFLPVLRVCFMPFVLCVRLCVRFGMGFMRVLRCMLLSLCFMGVLSSLIRAWFYTAFYA